MKERRFVPSGILRLGDRVRRDLRAGIAHSPEAILKVRAKRAALHEQLDEGEITPLRARVQYLRFASLIVAHVREHELETKDQPTDPQP